MHRLLIIYMIIVSGIFAQETEDLISMSLEDILNLNIVSVSKKAENIFESPLSASVITREEILNSGATTFEECLRLVPGLLVEALDGGAPACVSVFAGRLADLGIDYRPLMQDAVAQARKTRNIEIIWASTREVFNVVEADAIGCHIITAPADVLKKLPALGTKTDAELSLAAVKSFREDAIAAGLRLAVPASRAAE